MPVAEATNWNFLFPSPGFLFFFLLYFAGALYVCISIFMELFQFGTKVCFFRVKFLFITKQSVTVGKEQQI